MPSRNTLTYFFGSQGLGPWNCYFCGSPVFLEEDNRSGTSLTIHHKDEIKTNDSPSNLVPTHGSCHSSFHNRTAHIDIREKRGKSLRGKKRTKEQRKRMVEGRKTVPKFRLNCGKEPMYRANLVRHMKKCEICKEEHDKKHQVTRSTV